MDLMIPRLEKFATEGMFGEINVLRVGQSSNGEKSVQYHSQVGFFVVDLVTRKGKVRKVPVVVKLQLDAAEAQISRQFANEIITNAMVLPGLGANELGLHPNMYHGHATSGKDPKQDILILEDLRSQGFKTPDKVFLDPQHINLAMRKLGELHGLSYKIKASSPNKFNELKDQLYGKITQISDAYLKASILRGFQKDLHQSPNYSVLHKSYKKLISKDANEQILLLLAPEEPYAVIVHGDFLKDKVLYKYDENDNPCDAKLVDFAAVTYADPTVDLSQFLYMHTSEGREAHWNDHLKSYWEGVLSVGHPGFTYQEFLKNFAKKAVYGYIISAFYLPHMLHPENLHTFDSGFGDLSDDEISEIGRNYGGKDSTEAVESIVRHLHQEGYLEEYLLHVKQ